MSDKRIPHPIPAEYREPLISLGNACCAAAKKFAEDKSNEVKQAYRDAHIALDIYIVQIREGIGI